jgi:hypothetical protein
VQQHPGFEFARFNLGLIMNYLGYGAKDEEGALEGLNDSYVFIFDVKNMKAEIPLTQDGRVPRMSMMRISDVGRFVAAACLLPCGTWQEDFGMVGDINALDEIVRKIEKARGGKMEVVYRSYDQVVEEDRNETEVYPGKMWTQLEVMMAEDRVGAGTVEPVLNELCPEVRPMSVEEYLETFWV